MLYAFWRGFQNFWSHMGETMGELGNGASIGEAIRDVLTLKYLDGGGAGCAPPGEKPTLTRRLFHHLTFYGFLLCFAATSAGTLLHYIAGLEAPYAWISSPVVLGTLGGIGLLIGPAGLMWIKLTSDPALADQKQKGLDTGFLALLFLTSLTGFALLLGRAGAGMGVLLAIHLGVVLALFLTMPYGKFVHGIYRFAALIRYALERKRPNTNASFE